MRRDHIRSIVFIHAFPLDAGMWAGNAGALPEGWRALAPDLPGFGATPLLPGRSHSVSELAGSVIDHLDREQVTESVFVGCSMGGYVAFEIMRSAPRYVTALVLVSTRAGADSDEGKRGRQNTIALVDREGAEAVAAQMVPKLLAPQTQQRRPDLVTRLHGTIAANSPEGIKAALEAMRDRPDSTPLLSHIGVPTLIMHGAADGLIPPSEAESLHRAIVNSQLELIPDAGHLPNLEAADRFDARLGQFLSAQ